MPPKKATTTGAPKKAAAPASHASYKDMIKEAILQLKERNGSSRQAIKKYVQANNKINAATPSVFDSQFNRQLKAGVEAGEFTQPKGPSGPVKIAKKESKPAAPKAAPKKAATTKKAAAPKKPAAPKKEATTTTKKAAAPKKPAAAKPKANAAKPRKPAAAPAVVEKPSVINKTKSGRVTKTTAKPAAKKAAPKKAAPKKTASPKKKAESAPTSA